MEFFVPAKGDGAELRTAFLNEKKDLCWFLLGSFSGWQAGWKQALELYSKTTIAMAAFFASGEVGALSAQAKPLPRRCVSAGRAATLRGRLSSS